MAAILAALLMAAQRASTDHERAAGPFADAIRAAQQRVVKLYGGGIGMEQGYGSGVIVSADGGIVTTISVLLESPSLRVVLWDGRKLEARVTARDEARQLAEIQVDARDLPYFEPGRSDHLQPGDWLIFAANVFKVAEGDEPVTAMVGVLSGRATLEARRRAQDFVYEGPVLLADVIVATPGSAGGALLDADGRLVGVVGKAVISKRTNTWVNYALPVEEVAAFLRREATPALNRVAGAEPSASGIASERTVEVAWGLRLFDVGGVVRPAFVERVRVDSAAARAGLWPGDLIVSMNGQALATCGDVRAALAKLKAGQRATLVVKRREELVTLEMAPEAGPQ